MLSLLRSPSERSPRRDRRPGWRGHRHGRPLARGKLGEPTVIVSAGEYSTGFRLQIALAAESVGMHRRIRYSPNGPAEVTDRFFIHITASIARAESLSAQGLCDRFPDGGAKNQFFGSPSGLCADAQQKCPLFATPHATIVPSQLMALSPWSRSTCLVAISTPRTEAILQVRAKRPAERGAK